MIRRTRRNRQGGQALIEMALTFPMVLMIIFNFIAVMILAVDQQELSASVAAAANSTLSAPSHDGALIDAYAACSFSGQSSSLISGGCNLPASFPASVPTPGNFVTVHNIACNGALLNHGGVAANSCTASAVINFRASVLGAFVWWTPTISASITVYPSALRAQCLEGQTTC